MGGDVMNRGTVIPFPPRGRLATLPPHRIIAVGRNNELARDVFSRTALQHNLPGSSHSQATREAVPYSGMTPDAAPGGTRHQSLDTYPPVQEAPGSSPPGADWWPEAANNDLPYLIIWICVGGLYVCFMAAVTL
jgi:hypothetical protein